MITFLITSCDRLYLLKRTIESFLKFNIYPIAEYILVDDSGNIKAHDEIRRLYPDWTLILEPQNRGQVRCIDDAYSRVKTPYIFHCEDDWEFVRGGFIEPSLKILEHDKRVMLVVLSDIGMPVEPEVFKVDNIEYQLIGNDVNNWWHGFTWNPSLRRLSEYELVKPYARFIHERDSSITECHIGMELYDKYSYKAAFMNEIYCFHTGIGNQKRPVGC